jgi:hypothetical protein
MSVMGAVQQVRSRIATSTSQFGAKGVLAKIILMACIAVRSPLKCMQLACFVDTVSLQPGVEEMRTAVEPMDDAVHPAKSLTIEKDIV